MTEENEPQAPGEDATEVMETGDTSAIEVEDAAITGAKVKEYYGARRREKAAKRRESTQKRRALFVIASILAVLALVLGAEFALSAGRIHRGVAVAGIDVGGMSAAQASSRLSMRLAERSADPVFLEYQDQRWEITSAKIGLGFDERAQVKAAMAVGRRGDALASLAERLTCWTRGVEVSASPTAQSTKMDIVLGQIAEKIDVAPVNASVTLEGAKATVVEGEDGIALEREAAKSAILEAFAGTGSKSVQAPVGVATRSITGAEAADAAALAEKMLSGPVTVTFEAKKWVFAQTDVAKWIGFRVVESTATPKPILEPFISAQEASGPVTAALGTKVGRLAKNAEFKASDGKVTIIPSQDGVGPDVEDLALTLTEELKDEASDRIVELRTSRTRPEITTEKARTMGIKERISTYTTTYGSGNRPRVNNIHLLGDALDGTLVAPGGVFSFNATAGERTAAKGYQEAGAIVNGKLVPQLGGGVCQVGTTIFNTIFESGLPILERRNHSFYISHYPAGRDATVSWGGPDFKFKNDTPNWVLLVVGYSNSSITISLYGTDPGYEVSAQRGAWTNIRPFKTEEIDDPTLYVGVKSIEDGGVEGRSCIVKRTVSKGGKVLRIDTFASNYKPKVQVVRVGTKPRSSVTPTPTP